MHYDVLSKVALDTYDIWLSVAERARMFCLRWHYMRNDVLSKVALDA